MSKSAEIILLVAFNCLMHQNLFECMSAKHYIYFKEMVVGRSAQGFDENQEGGQGASCQIFGNH
jgi:hypothetical protein